LHDEASHQHVDHAVFQNDSRVVILVVLVVLRRHRIVVGEPGCQRKVVTGLNRLDRQKQGHPRPGL